MKSLFPLLLAVLALAPVLRAQDHIAIKTRLIETSIAVTPPLDEAVLARMKDVETLMAPSVCTISGQKATVEIGHELASGDEPLKSGIALEATPQVEANGIAYRIRVTKSDLVDQAVPQTGVTETVSHDVFAVGTVKDGEALWLRLTSPKKGRQVLVQVIFTRGWPEDVEAASKAADRQ